jgi:FkbM family methyltransferase
MRESGQLGELLRHAKKFLSPGSVIDVGAAYGEFTEECSAVFPDARYLLIEPLVEYQAPLSDLARRLPSAHYLCAAASSQTGEIAINVHPDLVGSSFLREVETGTDVNGHPRNVRTVTLDCAVNEAGARGPFLLKVDVQGAELEVLKGAEAVLKETEYLLLEVSFFKFFESGPQFDDVVEYMKRLGFVVYDMMGFQYRPLDNALAQADLAFVKESGRFRQDHFYATFRQRVEQNLEIRSHLSQRLNRGR